VSEDAIADLDSLFSAAREVSTNMAEAVSGADWEHVGALNVER
jgi:hypothetical protein